MPYYATRDEVLAALLRLEARLAFLQLELREARAGTLEQRVLRRRERALLQRRRRLRRALALL